jgi:hypothetical protein
MHEVEWTLFYHFLTAWELALREIEAEWELPRHALAPISRQTYRLLHEAAHQFGEPVRDALETGASTE